MERDDLIKIIIEILSEQEKRQARVNDIADLACKRNIHIRLSKEDLAKKMSAILSSEVKKKISRFARVAGKTNAQGKVSYKKGMYRLKKSSPVVTPAAPSPPNTNTAFIGKAGEYAVMSELLFYEFDVSLMTVDKGIDIFASKDNKFFYIQVKTATRRGDGSYFFSVKKNSFENNSNGAVYYIFLMRDLSNTFVVFPSLVLEAQIASGKIKDGDKTLSFTIKRDAKKKSYWLNNKFEINHYHINNFSIIK